MTDEQIMGINLPTGIPFVYELDENMKPVVSMKVCLKFHSFSFSRKDRTEYVKNRDFESIKMII